MNTTAKLIRLAQLEFGGGRTLVSYAEWAAGKYGVRCSDLINCLDVLCYVEEMGVLDGFLKSLSELKSLRKSLGGLNRISFPSDDADNLSEDAYKEALKYDSYLNYYDSVMGSYLPCADMLRNYFIVQAKGLSKYIIAPSEVKIETPKTGVVNPIDIQERIEKVNFSVSKKNSEMLEISSADIPTRCVVGKKSVKEPITHFEDEEFQGIPIKDVYETILEGQVVPMNASEGRDAGAVLTNKTPDIPLFINTGGRRVMIQIQSSDVETMGFDYYGYTGWKERAISYCSGLGFKYPSEWSEESYRKIFFDALKANVLNDWMPYKPEWFNSKNTEEELKLKERIVRLEFKYIGTGPFSFLCRLVENPMWEVPNDVNLTLAQVRKLVKLFNLFACSSHYGSYRRNDSHKDMLTFLCEVYAVPKLSIAAEQIMSELFKPIVIHKKVGSSDQDQVDFVTRHLADITDQGTIDSMNKVFDRFSKVREEVAEEDIKLREIGRARSEKARQKKEFRERVQDIGYLKKAIDRKNRREDRKQLEKSKNVLRRNGRRNPEYDEKKSKKPKIRETDEEREKKGKRVDYYPGKYSKMYGKGRHDDDDDKKGRDKKLRRRDVSESDSYDSVDDDRQEESSDSGVYDEHSSYEDYLDDVRDRKVRKERGAEVQKKKKNEPVKKVNEDRDIDDAFEKEVALDRIRGRFTDQSTSQGGMKENKNMKGT